MIGMRVVCVVMMWCAVARGVAIQPTTRPVERREIPGVEVQGRARELIFKVYKDEYARTGEAGWRALGRKLLAGAAESVEDSGAYFVMLDEARQLAGRGNDLETVLAANDAMGRMYPIDLVSIKIAAIQDSVRRGGRENHPLAAKYLCELGQTILAARDYAKGVALLPIMEAVDSSTNVPESVHARLREQRGAMALYERAAAALGDLEGADSRGKLLAGEFMCFVEGRWEKGLPLLAKGNDAAMADVAGLDLKNPETAAEQIQLGERWGRMAKRQVGVIAAGMNGRAVQWYRWAGENSKGLSGLEKALVEKRLGELASGGGATSRPTTAAAATSRPGTVPQDATVFEGRWYRVFATRVNWHEAQRRCELMGGHLACVNSEGLNAFVTKLAGGEFLWLGASRAAGGEWKWVNGQSLAYTHWADHQPNGKGDREYFLQLWRNGEWNDLVQQAGFICQWDP